MHSTSVRIVLGGLNAIIGTANTGNERVMVRHGYGVLNYNGERLVELHVWHEQPGNWRHFIPTQGHKYIYSRSLVIFSLMENGDDPSKMCV